MRKLNVQAGAVNSMSVNMIQVVGSVGLISLLVLSVASQSYPGIITDAKVVNIKCMSLKLRKQHYISVHCVIQPLISGSLEPKTRMIEQKIQH